MRLFIFTGICLALSAAGAGAQPISFTYAGQSSDQGVSVYADGLLSISQINPGTSLLSLTVSNVRSDYLGGDDNLRMYASALIGPENASFLGLNIFDTLGGDLRNDLVFGIASGLTGQMIDIDGTPLHIDTVFPDGFAFGFHGKTGGDGIYASDGINPGDNVTFEYEVTGVSFSFLDEYYRTLEGYFAIGRFQGVGAGGDDSAKTPGGGDGRIVAVPLPATTGLAFAGLGTVGVMTRRRR